MKRINVLSTFDGMSCGRIALKKAGISVNTYASSEIDNHAIKVALSNFPDIITLGDISDLSVRKMFGNTVIFNLKTRKVLVSFEDGIDLFIGGSPCQGFSKNGLQLNFEHSSSRLYFEYLRLLRECQSLNPSILFLLENVPMKKEWEYIITKDLGCVPVEINSSFFSAQNRRRLYWSNITFDFPLDKGIFLRDILESSVDEKYYLKGRRLDYWNRNFSERIRKKFFSFNSDKAICMVARQYANWSGNHVSGENGLVRQLTPIECERLQTIPDNYTAIASDIKC